MLVEVCLSDLTSAVNAAEGGATSIELCVDRVSAGGVTPSYGLICAVVKKVAAINKDVQVNVLIRPRDGDFVYSEDEFNIILDDIGAAKRGGAHGVVVGVLTREGLIDIERMRLIREASLPLCLTFHRAFDVVDISGGDVLDALQDVITLGCDRLLTSGTASKAISEAGTACLKRLAEHVTAVSSSLKIIAASGITAQNCSKLIAATGVHGIHAGGAVTMTIRCDEKKCEGVNDFSEKFEVNVDCVRELVHKSTC